MPTVLQRWLPLALLALLALGLRTWDLDRRPMHADEANQAVKTGQLLEGHGYTFDPADHHGPTLYYAALPLAWIRGESTLAELTETTVRLVPALAGTLAVLLLYFLAHALAASSSVAETAISSSTRRSAFFAAAFLAVSPSAVYFSRFFIQETLLLTFTLATFLFAARWWRSGRLAWALAAGASAGLMQATKASAPLFLLAALAGLLIARPSRPATLRLTRDLTAAFAAALLIAALFYSSFGANAGGIRDALGTYPSMFDRLSAGASGHEKPAWYYFSFLGWHRDGGVVTHQLVFSLLALTGAVIAIVSRPSRGLRGAASFTVILLLVFSLTSYKTPWHVIHLIPGLSLLAAGALVVPRKHPSFYTLIGILCVLLQLGQVRLTSFQRPADERNPYAYVHSSSDVLKLRPLAQAAHAAFPSAPIRVISEESWPMPWYFRDIPNIGYWSAVPDDCDGSLVIASAGLADQVEARLKGNYTPAFIGLRPGFTLIVFKRQP